jgi:hydrogenase expression/formation protein HypE
MNSEWSCPTPLKSDSIRMAHGGGGRLMRDLIEKYFLSAFENPLLNHRHDSTVIPSGSFPLAFTTDSYVVHPLFFPGGDIGSLAINGTVNDLAMSASQPLYLSCAFIIEEGLPFSTLERVLQSMKQAAHQTGITIITGDTKVVDKGKGDLLFINTSGIGQVLQSPPPDPSEVHPGDAIIVSGDLGRHGIAVLSVREGLQFQTSIQSDCAPLASAILDLIHAAIPLHCLRDLTRGGLAAALNEIALDSHTTCLIEEHAIPIEDEVQGACELLGLDPLYVANEGRFVAFVPPSKVIPTLQVLHASDYSQAACIGYVTEKSSPGKVLMKNTLGVIRMLDSLSGEQLPRIC